MKTKQYKTALICIAFTALSMAFGSTEQPIGKKIIQSVDKKSYQLAVERLAGAAKLPNGTRLMDRHGLEHMKLVHDFFRTTFKEAGFSEVYEQNFELYDDPNDDWNSREAPGKNLYVTIPGSVHPEQVILIGAHYDTTGPEKPGANDNASGAGAILELAKRFKTSGLQPERTIAFVLFDAEEPHGQKDGLFQGSREFFKKFKKQYKFELFINVDMIGYSPTGFKHLLYDPNENDQITSLVEKAMHDAEIEFGAEVWEGHISDSRSGHEAGIETVSFLESPRDKKGRELREFPYWHSYEDTVDKINFEYATQIVQIIGATALEASRPKHWSKGMFTAKVNDKIKDRIEKRVKEAKKYRNDKYKSHDRHDRLYW